MVTDPRNVYAEREIRFAQERDRCAAHSRRITRLRLLAFLAALAPLLWPLPAGERIGPVRLVLSMAFAVSFIALIVYHQKHKLRCNWWDQLSKLNLEGRRRLARDWEALPAQEPVAADPDHPFADDLDLFGRASLASLLSTVGTPGGLTKLRSWLLEPAGAASAKARQAAVAELAPLLDLREELTVRGRLMADVSPDGLAAFAKWAAGDLWLAKRPWLIWTARLLPILTFTLIVLFAMGRVDYTAPVALLLASMILSYTVGREVHRIFDRAFAREEAYAQYAKIFRLVGTSSFEAPLLQRLKKDLEAEGGSAHVWIARLRRLVALSEVRFSMGYILLQGPTLWDFHVLHELEKWQRAAGHQVARWFTAADDFDALAGLAGLKHDNPGWAFAEFTDGGSPVLHATDLGHPLLADDVRICNDVEVGPPQTFLLVSGSNMSGKSTLLRAIGTNVVLALAGGPVCAAAMRLPALEVATSMRIHDSLQQGLSHFKAELDRLKWVVDRARAASEEGSTLLYLLDDVLQGTNTAERQIAARRVIGALLGESVIGAVTTHDLALAETPALSAAARPVHFTETIADGRDGPKISFDYKLRPGIATSSNALKLLEMVGLPSERLTDDRADSAD